MKLICEQCGARYSIADEKVRGKVFKIRCKKCDNVIVVKGDGDGGALVGMGSAGFDGSIEAAELASGRVALDSAPSSGGGAPWAEAPASPIATNAPAPVWYLLLGQQQVGPLTDEQVGEYITAGQAGPDTFVWREGFGDWAPLQSLPSFSVMLSASPAFITGPAPAQVGAGFGGGLSSSWTGEGYDFGGAGVASSAGAAAAGPDGGGGGMFSGFEMAGGGPSLAPMPAGPDKMVGARNENSVLFSLATLQNLAIGGPAQPEQVATRRPSTGAVSSNSGLIDMRSVGDEGALVGVGGLEGVAPALPPPAIPAMMVPVMTRRSSSTGLIVGLSVAGVLVLALLVVVVVLLTRPASPVASAPPAAGSATAAGTEQASKGTEAAPAEAASAKAAEPAATAGSPAPAEGGDAADKVVASAAATKPRSTSPGTTSTARPAPAPTAAPRPEPAPQPVAAPAPRPAPVVAAAPTAPVRKGGSEVDDLLDGIEQGRPKKAAAPPAAAAAAAVPAPAAAPAAAATTQRPLSREDIATVVRANKGKVQACYERQAEPKISGTLMVSFVIQRNGQVSSSAIQTPTFDGTPVGQCVLSAVRSFSFPAHTDPPVKINYPFILR